MQWLTLTIQPTSPFMTQPKGDTLFGQLCWHLRDLLGGEALVRLLSDYEHEPAFVVSDLLPQGQVPMPQVPLHWMGEASLSSRQLKRLKKRRFVPDQLCQYPLSDWLQWLDDAEQEERASFQPVFQMHNSINRITQTTDERFTPFRLRKWLLNGEMTLHICHDPERIDADTLHKAVEQMGLLGFGKRASTGHGRFMVKDRLIRPHAPVDTRAWLTLAPAMPDTETLDPDRTAYTPFARWGRHGRELVHTMPFKAPVLMMDTGALITLETDWKRPWWGRALVDLSSRNVIDALGDRPVHQGYAPILPVEVS